MNPVRGILFREGKTQKIWSVEGHGNLVIHESKSDVTAYDNPLLTKQFAGKAEYATLTTCRVFDLLMQARIPVAYQKQFSPTEFLAEKCEVIPLEVCVRRYAPWYSSYTKRHPELLVRENEPPPRFHRLSPEFFLKTTKGELKDKNGCAIVEGLRQEYGEEDPLIEFTNGNQWKLLHSKYPRWDSAADLNRTIPMLVQQRVMGEIEKIALRAFLVIEGAWKILGYHLIDGKFEFGRTFDGRLVIIDVFDNDSWRLCDLRWQELSKETFRQKMPLEKVKRCYALVAEMTKLFRVPRQVFVLWRGSSDDAFPVVKYRMENIEYITLPVHKKPRECLIRLEQLERDYPEGGIIVAKVRESEFIRSLFASHTTWPVITIPATSDDSEEQVMDFAVNALAVKNPVFYMERRFRIEALDT